jgi:hypothetical protein
MAVRILGDLDDAVFESKSLVLKLMTLGGSRSAIEQLVRFSARLTHGTLAQQEYFYAALLDCLGNQDREFLSGLRGRLAANESLAKFLLRVPMEMAREFGGEVMERKFERSSFVGERWPIEDWISEVTGMAYHEGT